MTVWGLADDDTWLDTFPVVRNDAPLLFDEQLQAKPAYWGIVDPTRIEASASPTTAPTSAPPPTTTPPTTDSCQVTYRIVGQWPGGFQGEVRITPRQAAASWTVRWAFPNGQRINQGWSGVFAQSGANVAVTNTAWNGSIPAGGAVTFGFIASWSGTNGLPTSFTLNDSVCLVP